MRIEKILGCVAAILIILCSIVYLTLPEQGEQVYIPSKQLIPEDVEIPEGYKLVENYTDVYYVESDEGIKYFWLVQFSDGSYGWQEVDENGNIVFPNRETEPEQTLPNESEPTEPETDPDSEPTNSEETNPDTEPSESEEIPLESNEMITSPVIE